MHYKKSKEILDHVNKAGNILINCHRGPDPDSVGSALALGEVMENLGKKVKVICSSKQIYDNVDFLRNYGEIENDVDFTKFDFSKFDLFLALDSSSWDMVSSSKVIPIPDIPIFVLDHHHTNTRYGKINLVDENVSSVGELLYLVFTDWDIKINKSIATSLLTAIIGDTGIFKYPNTTLKTLKVASELMDLGANKNQIVDAVYRNYDFKLIKFWGEVLNLAILDEDYKFVYSFIPYEAYVKWGKPENAKEIAADLFTQSTKGTNFGFVGLETEKNKMSLSFRSRLEFDTSQIATELGGGGHQAASGAKVEGMNFDKAVEKTLQVVRKYAKKS